MRTICGTHKYLAPELVQCDRGQLQGYDKAIDMCAPAPTPNLHTLLIPSTCVPLPQPPNLHTLLIPPPPNPPQAWVRGHGPWRAPRYKSPPHPANPNPNPNPSPDPKPKPNPNLNPNDSPNANPNPDPNPSPNPNPNPNPNPIPNQAWVAEVRTQRARLQRARLQRLQGDDLGFDEELPNLTLT